MIRRFHLSENYYVEVRLPRPLDFDGDSYYFRVGQWYIRFEEGNGYFGIWVVKKARVRRWIALKRL